MGYDTLQIKGLKSLTLLLVVQWSSGLVENWSKGRISPGDTTQKIPALKLEWLKSYQHVHIPIVAQDQYI